MKKMNFVTKGLALLLMGVMLAGCGDKATESSSDDKQQESSVEDKSSESSEEKESTEEASTEESSVASTDESTVESTKESSQTIGDEPTDKVKKYVEYFKNFTMDGKMITMNMDEEVNGKKISIELAFGSKDGDSYLFMSVPSASGENNEMSAYFMKDQTAYVEVKMAGQESVAQKTTGMDPETASQMNLAGSMLNLNTDGDFSLNYLGEETIDGVTYDVLQPTDTEEATLYVNVATQEWEMIKATSDGQEAVAYIRPSEKITVPASLSSAEEVNSEDFSQVLVFGLMGIISSAQGE